MTTKDQERKALEKIRKIVEDLGDNSYIGMAFEGCFEIAEENIENDFGCSMKQRWENAEEQVDKLEADNSELKQRCEAADELIEVYKKQHISNNDRMRIVNLIQEKLNELNDIGDDAAAKIVEYAENPGSEEFKKAVRFHRETRENYNYYRTLMETVVETMRA